ncbi:MAG: sulfatase, partial [archaeon]
PNIIFITLDTLRADHLQSFGYEKETSPFLDSIVENSVVFENSIASSSWTLPSHASLFTGKDPVNHNAVRTHQFLDLKHVTLAEILAEAGYNTVGFAGGPNCKKKFGIAQGVKDHKDRLDFFEHTLTYDDYSIANLILEIEPNFLTGFGIDGELTSEQINKEVFDWLNQNSEHPFFMFINYFDVHLPYNLGSEYNSLFFDESIKQDINTNDLFYWDRYAELPSGMLEYVIGLYDSEIMYLDQHIKALFNQLDTLEIKENTIIIITEDHGEEFYDHGGFDHSLTLYDEVIKTPLIIYYPKEFEPQKIDARVNTLNIFSTLLEMLDLGSKIPSNIDSTSLLPLIENQEGFNETTAFSELYARFYLGETEQKAVSANNWKLITVNPETETLPTSLFDIKEDPAEKNNLYTSEAEKKEELQQIRRERFD